MTRASLGSEGIVGSWARGCCRQSSHSSGEWDSRAVAAGETNPSTRTRQHRRESRMMRDRTRAAERRGKKKRAEAAVDRKARG
jgi:hypothetical protein